MIMGIMKVFCFGVLLVALIFPLFTSVEGRFHFSRPDRMYSTVVSDSHAQVTRKYDRIQEVEKACEAIIDAASELGSNDNRAYSIRHDLSFSGGDWDQEPDKTHPLMPYSDYVGFNYSDVSSFGSLVKLSGFRITDVENAHRSKKTVWVNGVLDLVITRNGFDQIESSEPAPQFQMWMGHSQVSAFFQGVYTESGGERVLCLLGSAKFPVRPWGYLNATDSYQHLPLWQDDQIQLVIHYPMKFTLTQRAIQGEMNSLRSKSHISYFDKVRILSQLTTDEYEFGAQAIHKACDSYPHLDKVLEGGIDIYKGNDFCSFFNVIQRRGLSVIILNWRCNVTDEFCSKLGPFVTEGSHGDFKDFRLLIQNVQCEQKPIKAKVALVLRIVPSHVDIYYENRRSGLGNMTLAAEGVWNSTEGQLCMVGCPGVVDSEGNACDSRICFYIPTTFTINQRSVLMGSISSIKAKNPSYFPLSFRIPFHNRFIYRLYRYTNLRYKYTKIDLAGGLMDKDEPSSPGNIIKKSLLKFPRLQENEGYNSSASVLAEDLTFSVSAVFPSPSSSVYVYMEILSVGSVLGPYSRASNFSFSRGQTPYHEKAEYTKKQLLVNVSAQLTISSVDIFSNFSSLLLEGLYDPLVGKMYMIGCRDVRATSTKILLESNDLEDGFDCLTEVVISYPPVTAQWLLQPGVRISITSKRPQDDPFYFDPVTLKTRPITYRSQREGVLSEREIEGVLRVLTLSILVACIVLQLFYVGSATDSVPYVSLVMLGIQALGYGLPLTTSVESLFKRKHSEGSSYELENVNGQLYQAIGMTEKLLVLTAFLLTLRLSQKVWKSRVRLLRRAPQEPRHVPNDKLVLLVTAVIHLAGFVCVLFVHNSKTSQETQWIGVVSSSSDTPKQWMVLLEEYTGLVQDLFLFPQVVGNLVWQVKCKPLRKLFYVGISFVRLLPHAYDYVKASKLNPYSSTDYVFIDPDTDFHSKFSDVFIPVMTVLLAALVYVQQRWNYQKLSDVLVVRRWRLLPLRPKVYKKLPSEFVESELASTGNSTSIRDQEA